MSVHIPVLLEESIENLNLSPEKTFIDATLDGGGHTKAILGRFPGIKALGIELDPVELAEFKTQNPDLLDQLIIVNDSYVNLAKIVQDKNIKPDAILFD